MSKSALFFPGRTGYREIRQKQEKELWQSVAFREVSGGGGLIFCSAIRGKRKLRADLHCHKEPLCVILFITGEKYLFLPFEKGESYGCKKKIYQHAAAKRRNED